VDGDLGPGPVQRGGDREGWGVADVVRVGLERGAPDGDPLAGLGAAEGVAGEFDGVLAPR